MSNQTFKTQFYTQFKTQFHTQFNTLFKTHNQTNFLHSNHNSKTHKLKIQLIFSNHSYKALPNGALGFVWTFQLELKKTKDTIS